MLNQSITALEPQGHCEICGAGTGIDMNVTVCLACAVEVEKESRAAKTQEESEYKAFLDDYNSPEGKAWRANKR